MHFPLVSAKFGRFLNRFQELSMMVRLKQANSI